MLFRHVTALAEHPSVGRVLPVGRGSGHAYGDYPLAFAQAQVAAWRGRAKSDDLEPRLRAEMARHPNVFLLEIIGRDVVVHRSRTIEDLVAQGHQLEVVRRADIFRRLLSDAVCDAPMRRRVVIAVDTGDLAEDRRDLPLFSFQRRRGDRTLLLPDFELVSLDYLAIDEDTLAFHDKANEAFFSGSTTGKASFSMEDIDRGEVPRVRAARHFRGHPRVRFLLPSIVQHASEAVSAALRAEGFGQGRTQLLDSYASKFAISIDGNGAPCSRPAIILKSNSALLKYDSAFELYYSIGLVPWLHFIPVATDSDVIDVVGAAVARPQAFEYIAENGRAFAESILSREPILRYTRHLLDLYADVIA